MPLVLLFAFPAVVLVLMWLIGETGIQDDAGWTVFVAFSAAVAICASAADRWERRARRRRMRRYT